MFKYLIVPDTDSSRVMPYLYYNCQVVDTAAGALVRVKEDAGFTAQALMDRLASGLMFAKPTPPCLAPVAGLFKEYR